MTVTIENTYTGNGSTTDYSFTFPYLDTSDIKVTLATVATTAYSLLNATTVRFDSAPGNGVAIRIYRETAFDTPKATFYPGSAIRASDLNDNTLQNLYVNQESNDKVADAWLSGDPTVISTESWYTTDDTKVATTKAIEGRIDAKIDTALTGDIAAGNKITITDNSPSSGQITVALTSGSLVNSDVNASAAIAGTKITPSFGSQNVSTSGTLASGAATVTGNIAVSGTVDGRDVAADGTKLDGIETNATADQTNAEIRAAVEAASDSNVFTDADHTKLNAIEDNATRDQTAAEIRTLVESASDSNVFTDADHSKLNAIEASATADQTAAEIRTLVESASDSNVFTDADHTKLNAIEANATADQTASEIKTLLQSDKLTASEIADSTITSTQIATGALDGRYYTETELTSGALDGRYYTETESDARYFNISTGDTIKDGDTFPDNDTTIATTAAINDRIIDLVDDVGGFVPIANETSFPAANPDVNNGAGTLVSIKALANNLTSNGSGVATIANGAGSGNTVTINGLANSTTYAATFGMIVETTSTLHTYTFHRQVPKATEVSTVAGSISNVNAVGGNISNVNTVAGNNSNITTVAGANSNITSVAGSISNVNTVATNISSVNDFAARYRVASSAPSSSLDTGDLYFDTSANELKVYNGSSWQGGVTATGNLAGLGSNTFTGSQSLGDNNKVQLGASNDLQIYHNGSHSFIHDGGTGDLRITGSTIKLLDSAQSENILVANENGSVELYYDSSKKFHTTAGGAYVTGTLDTTDTISSGNSNIKIDGDTGKFLAGASNDLQIYHDPSNGGNIIDAATSENVWIKNNAGSANEAMGAFRANGSSELYYDASKKFETFSWGAKCYGYFAVDGSSGYAYTAPDNSKVSLGTGNDLQIYHDGSNSWIKDTGTGMLRLSTNGSSIELTGQSGSEYLANFIQDGAVDLYYDGSKKLYTYADGAKIEGDFIFKQADGTTKASWNGTNNYIKVNDSTKFVAGTGDDLQLYHDGTKSYITSGTELRLKMSSEDSVIIKPNDSVVLCYDNDIKFETKSYGAFINGHLQMDDSSIIKLGNSLDLQIYHDGSNSYIVDQGTGVLVIQGSATKIRNDQGHVQINASNDVVELYYDNTKRAETTNSGFNVVGALTVNGSALSSAPQITATANGSISANESVIVESDGKVAGVTGFSFGQGSNHVFTSSMGGHYNNHFDSDRSHGSQGLILYEDSSSNRWYLKVATFSGTSVTYNTGTMVKDSAFGTHGAVANVSAGVYVIVYNSGGGEYARVVTVSGSGGSATVTLGTELNFSESGSNNMQNVVLQHMRNTSDKLILAYHDNYNGSGEGRVLTISGTGASASVSSSGKTQFNNNRPYNMKGTYDTTNNVVAVTYTQSGTTGPHKIHALKLDGSGNFSAGNVQSAFSFNCYGADIIYDSVNDMIWTLGESNSNNYKYVRSMEYNSNNNYYQTLGNSNSIGGSSTSADQGSHRIGFDSNTGTIAVFFSLNDSLFMDYGKINSSNQVSWTGSPITVTTDMTSSLHVTGVKGTLSNGRIPVLFREESDDDGVMRVRQFAGTDMTTENFIGFSSAAYSNGDTATINVVGATSTQSSLTPGQKYYVQNDGTIGLTAADPNVYAGIAIASNKLLIKG